MRAEVDTARIKLLLKNLLAMPCVTHRRCAPR
jgi:hypothetical protein